MFISTQWSLFFWLSHQYPINILMSPFVLHALPISSSLTWSFLLYLSKSTNYEAPRHAIFSQPAYYFIPLQFIYSPQHKRR
jgi:hypothetical protein